MVSFAYYVVDVATVLLLAAAASAVDAASSGHVATSEIHEVPAINNIVKMLQELPSSTREEACQQAQGHDLHSRSEDSQLTQAVTSIMLSDKMANVFANIVQVQIDARLGAGATTMSHQLHPHRDRYLAEVPAVSTVTCSLSGCGDDEPCSSWNKVLDNVDNCHQCGNKKHSANDLLGCSCTYSCAVPEAETPAATASPEISVPEDGGASGQLGDTSLWVEIGKLAFGPQADVCLFKDPDEGADGLRLDKSFKVDGNITVADSVTIKGMDVLGAIEQIEDNIAELDAVAVKSSSAGTQTLGAVTATSLSVSGGVQVGSDTEACTEAKQGTLRFEPTKQLLQICSQDEWTDVNKQKTGTQTNPGTSCMSIKDAGDAVPGQGVYWINPDGSGAFKVDCDMAGGGWIKLQLFKENNAKSLYVGQHSPSNTWDKCPHDEARFFDFTNSAEAPVDVSYAKNGDNYGDFEINLSYKQPSTGNKYTTAQINALRSLPALDLHESTRIVALTVDDDGYNYQDGGSTGFEVRLRAQHHTSWKVMTPGASPNCPSGNNDGAYYIWSTNAGKNEVHGDTGGISASSMGALPHDLVIPYAVRLDIHTGGGCAFGWEKEVFMVRES